MLGSSDQVAVQSDSGDNSNDSGAVVSQDSGNLDSAVDTDTDSGTDTDSPVDTGEPLDRTTLRGAAKSTGRIVGVALNAGAMNNDPDYVALLVEQFGGITPENATKWGSVQPDSETWDFSAADAMLDLAAEHNLRVKGHTLVWHSQMPAWVSDSMSAQELSSAIDAHFSTILPHFGTSVADWDVVNEALEWNGAMRESIFYSKFGAAYVRDAFALAAVYAPHARLFYNDYSIEGVNSKSDAAAKLLADIQKAGVAVHGVGLQMHLTHGNRPSREDISANIQRFGDLGLLVHISEMDVQIRHLEGPQSERLLAQAMTYYDVIAACVENAACEQITFWGYTDRYSWIDSWFGEDDPLLYDEELLPKAAREAVHEALLGEPMSGCEDSRMLNGGFEDGDAEWFTWGSVNSIVSTETYSGNNALLSKDRSSAWQGPVQSVFDRIGDGLVYEGVAQVKLKNASSDKMLMTLKWVDDAGEHWRTIASGTANSSGWTELRGNLDFSANLTTGTLREASVYVEGPAPGVEFYVDDVVFKPVCPATAVPVVRE